MDRTQYIHHMLISNQLPLGTVLPREDGSALVVTMYGTANCDNWRDIDEELTEINSILTI